jgi:PAS domain S-box-containing protein
MSRLAFLGLQNLLDSTAFMPHGHCYLWKSPLVWENVIADSVIWLAYTAIPVAIICLILRKIGKIPYNWVFWSFATFIVACGITHLLEVITIWHPYYWLAAHIKVLTAMASITTAIALVKHSKKIVALLSGSTFLKIQDALEEHQHRFQLLANSIPQLAWMTAPDGKLIWCNDQLYDYTGKTLNELEGWNWTCILEEKEKARVINNWSRALREGHEWEDTFLLRNKNGEYRPHLSRAKPIFTNGVITMWFGTNTDITSLVQAEEAAISASRAKDRFIAVLSHELRNPLTPIVTSVDILESEIKKEALSAPAIDALNMIRHNIHLEATLIDDLLDMTSSRSGKIKLQLEPTNLLDVLARSFQSFSTRIRAKKIRVCQQLEAHDNYVMADSARLHQILSNLIGNAVKFSEEQSEVFIHVFDDHECVVFEISDHGIGIDPSVIDRIFDPFEQYERKAGGGYGGLGLGLTIAQNLTKMHKGSLQAFSEGVGKGAKFTLKLMKAERPPDALPFPPLPNIASDPTKPRVLLVEDHRDTLRSMAFIIRGLGYEVQSATTVREAKVHAIEGDILVSDIGLPDGNGYNLMKELRTRGIRGIAVSGFGQEEDVERSKDAGFSEHLIKPIDRRALANALSRLIEASSPPPWLAN